MNVETNVSDCHDNVILSVPENDEETLDYDDVLDQEDELICDGVTDGNKGLDKSFTKADSEIEFNLKRGKQIEQRTNLSLYSYSLTDTEDVEKQIENLKGSPAFEKYIQAMVAKEIQSAKTKGFLGQPSVAPAAPPKKGIVNVMSPVKQSNVIVRNSIKSPSDTTIYAPALNKTPVKDILVQNTGAQGDCHEMQGVNDHNHISQFIEAIRLGTDMTPRSVVNRRRDW